MIHSKSAEAEKWEEESCVQMLSAARWMVFIDDVISRDFWSYSPSRPLMHGGHLFFCCHLSCQWQMTQRQPGGTGRTHSPQAKLVRDLVYLSNPPAPPPPPLSSHSISTASRTFFTRFPDFAAHLAVFHFFPSDETSPLFFLSVTHSECDCESLRIVLSSMPSRGENRHPSANYVLCSIAANLVHFLIEIKYFHLFFLNELSVVRSLSPTAHDLSRVRTPDLSSQPD